MGERKRRPDARVTINDGAQKEAFRASYQDSALTHRADASPVNQCHHRGRATRAGEPRREE